MYEQGGPLRRLHTTVLLAVVVVGIAACGDSDGSDPQAGPTRTTIETPEPAVGGLDFAAGSKVELGDGWSVAPCESGPPLFCVRRQGRTESVIELMSVPTASYTAVKRVLDEGGSAADALRAHAEEYQQTFERDRPAGCGAGYRVQSFGPRSATVAGRPGVLYGFDGHQDDRHVERALQFATIEGETLHLIFTTAIEDDTCMDDGTLAEFAVAELNDLEPTIVRMIAASKLP